MKLLMCLIHVPGTDGKGPTCIFEDCTNGGDLAHKPEIALVTVPYFNDAHQWKATPSPPRLLVSQNEVTDATIVEL